MVPLVFDEENESMICRRGLSLGYPLQTRILAMPFHCGILGDDTSNPSSSQRHDTQSCISVLYIVYFL